MTWDDVELPQSWKVGTIGDVAKVVGGGTPKTSVPGNFSETDGHPWITPADLTGYSDKYIRRGRRFLTEQGLATSSATYLPKGSVLFSSRAPIGYVAIAEAPVTTNQGFRSFVPSNEIDPEYLYYALRFLKPAAEQMASGTTFAELSGSKAARLPLAYPPPIEQRRIVAALNIATARSSTATAHLAAAHRAIERFRQAVLAAACSGRLTAQWRDVHGVGGWEHARAEDVCSKVQSGTTPKTWHVAEDGVPFLKVYNIVDQRLDFDHRPQFISRTLHYGSLRRATALPGDVLMNIVGPPLGKVAIVTDQYAEWSIHQALTLFRPSNQITTEWLYIFMCSGISVRGILDATRGTVGQVNISLSQCRNFELPIPSIEEQREAVTRVERLLTLADALRARIDTTLFGVEQSSQAVLAKAFRGELVTA